jgi:hypothetical protein
LCPENQKMLMKEIKENVKKIPPSKNPNKIPSDTMIMDYRP